MRGPVGKGIVKASVDEVIVADGELTFAISDFPGAGDPPPSEPRSGEQES